MPDTPLTHDKIMEIFDTKESDCDKVKSDIKALPDDNKLTNASAKARALAMADYACKYFEFNKMPEPI